MNEEKEIKVNTASKPFDIKKSEPAVDLRPGAEKHPSGNPPNPLFQRGKLLGKEGKIPAAAIENKESKLSLEKLASYGRGAKNAFGAIKGLSGILDKTIKRLLYLLAFLLPLFVLPFSMEIYEFNKTLLLFFISGLAFLLWLAKMILVNKKIEIVRTPLDLPIVIFISLILISTAFSVDKISSVLGFYGRFSDSLLVYLSLAMVYFVGVSVIASGAVAERGNPVANGNNRNSGSDDINDEIASVAHSATLHSRPRNDSNFTNNLIRAFLASSFIVVIASLIYSFGFKFIPWDEVGFRSFNFVGGSLNILAIYLTAVILIALGNRGAAANVLSKHLMSVLIIMSLILLTLIDFILAWIVLAVCLVLALGLAGARKLMSKNNNKDVIASGAVAERGNPAANGNDRNNGSDDINDEIASVAHSATLHSRPRNDSNKSSFIFSSLILLISIAFIATSLTALNDNVQSDLESSLISSSIKNRLISSNNNQIANDGFTREISLDKNTAVSIAMAGLKNVKSDPISVIIGSGPGTYLYNFSKFKPAKFNNSAFWNLRFDKAGSEILEKVSTIGILGALSYLIIIFLAMGMFLKMMFKKIPLTPFDKGGRKEFQSPLETGTLVYLFAAWFGLLLFQFLYLEATTIKLIFWLLTMVLAVEYCASAGHLVSKDTGCRDRFALNLKKEPSAFYSSLAALVIITAAFGYSYYHQINFYQADTIYKNARAEQNEALRNSNLTPEGAWEVLDRGAGDLEKAIEKNPHRGEYKIYLSDIYLNRANLAFQEESKKSEEEKNNARIAAEVKNAIDYAKNAADASPNNIIFQQKLAVVYAALAKNMGVIGAGEWAVKSYQKAIELEPTNPVLRAELGKIYAAADKTDLAISELENALELKNNYLDAGLQLGLAYEKQENNQKAIRQLSSLGSVEKMEDFIAAGQIVGPNSSSVDIDIAFQLGRIYYNEGEISRAKSIFLKITKANPTHSNAHYSLGLIYEKEGNDEMALREFEIVLAANQENEEVKEKVDELREGVKEVREIKEE